MHDPVAYRASAPLCPPCERPLRPVNVPEAEIDQEAPPASVPFWTRVQGALRRLLTA